MKQKKRNKKKTKSNNKDRHMTITITTTIIKKINLNIKIAMQVAMESIAQKFLSKSSDGSDGPTLIRDGECLLTLITSSNQVSLVLYKSLKVLEVI